MTENNENPDFCTRLECIIGKLPDNKKTFAKKCGISEKQLYIYLKGTSDPGMRFFSNMKIQYPMINIEWLITGIGEPDIIYEDLKIKSSNKDVISYENAIENEHLKLIKKFKNKETALNANKDLLDIEQYSSETFMKATGYLKGLRDGVVPDNVSEQKKVDEWTGQDRRKNKAS